MEEGRDGEVGGGKTGGGGEISILDVTIVRSSDDKDGEVGQDVHGIDHFIFTLVFVCWTLTYEIQQNMLSAILN